MTRVVIIASWVGLAAAAAAVLATRPAWVRRLWSRVPLPFRRHDAAVGLAVSTLTAMAVMAPVFVAASVAPLRRIFGVQDYDIHRELANGIDFSPVRLDTPHPVWHLAYRVVEPISGQYGAAVVMVMITALFVVGVVMVASHHTPDVPGLDWRIAVVLPFLIIFTESPTALVNAVFRSDDPRPFAPVHFWGNPTDTLAIAVTPMVVLLVLRVVRTVEQPMRRPETVGLAALIVVTTAAKPSFTLVLVPALVMFLVVSGQWSSKVVKELLVFCAIPGGIVAALQSWNLRVDDGFFAGYGVTIDPLALVEIYGFSAGGPAFWLGPLTIAAIGVYGGKRFVTHPPIQLLLCALLVSLVPLLLLKETGNREFDGNLGKSGLICYVMLWLFSLRFLVGDLVAWRNGTRPVRRPAVLLGICLPLVVLAVASGVIGYLDALDFQPLGVPFPVFDG